MTRAVLFADYLSEIEAETPAAGGKPSAAMVAEAALPASVAEEPPKRDHDAELAAEYHRGWIEGEAAARATTEAAIADLRLVAEQRLAQEREVWAREVGDAMLAALSTGLSSIEARLAESLARALRPLVATAVERRAIDDLRRALAEALTTGQHRRVEIGGPERIIEQVRNGLVETGAAPDTIITLPNAGPEVRIRLDDAVVETQIQAWGKAIEKVMEGA